MRYFFSNTVFFAAAVLLVFEIRSDTVKLKNGKIYENVKTSLSGNTLSIVYENGKKEILNADAIAELKPVKTHWKETEVKRTVESEMSAKEEKTRDKTPAKTEKRTEKKSVSSENNYSYLYSLIPGWSSLNTGRYWYAGLAISLLEFGAMRRISGKNEVRPLLDEEDGRNLQIISLLNMKDTSGGNMVRDAALIGYFSRHTADGRDAHDGLETFLNRRNAVIFLSAVTVIDVLLSRILQETKSRETENTSLYFTFRSSGRENFSLAFTKNF